MTPELRDFMSTKSLTMTMELFLFIFKYLHILIYMLQTMEIRKVKTSYTYIIYDFPIYYNNIIRQIKSNYSLLYLSVNIL